MDGPLPPKVRWAFDHTNIDPSFASDSTLPSLTSDSTASSLAFVNSQLISHGFIRSPGLQLHNLPARDQESAAKCLIGLLGQRMHDVARADEINTKLRTLNYDHERLSSLYKSSQEQAENAERETELAKSKMNAAIKTLAAEQSSHKQTSSTLQKSKAALQSVRTNSQYEIKRKEKEMERMTDRWNKIVNEQARLGSVGTGIDCANLAIVDGGNGPVEDPLMEKALAESEASRSLLLDENDAFRDVVLSAARGLQSLVYDLDPSITTPPPLLTAAQFYSSSTTNNGVASLYDASAHALNAHAKLKEMIASVRKRVDQIQRDTGPAVKEMEKKLEVEVEEKRVLARDLERIKSVVGELKDELARKDTFDLASQQKAVIENLLADERYMRKSDPDESRDTLADEKAAELLAAREEEIKRQEDEVTQAAVRLGMERESLEAERRQLLEEKRAWLVQQTLSETPDTPELRREQDIGKDLAEPSAEEKNKATKKRVEHHVRRPSRTSLGSPPAGPPPLPPPPQPQPQPPQPKEKHKHKEKRSTKPESKSTTPPPEPEAGPSKTTKAPASNPFEEVLQRSAQRPRPVFSDGSGALPSFQPPVAALSLGEAAPPPPPPPTQQKQVKIAAPPSPRRSPPHRPRGGPSVTPYRRIVGKPHQYAPANPSPLAKVMMMTGDSSSEISADDIPSSSGGGAEESFSPTNHVVASIVASGARGMPLFAGGRAKAPASVAKSLDLRGGEEEEDEEGVWVPIEDAPPPPALVQRNADPLTEDDLVMLPKKPSSSKLKTRTSTTTTTMISKTSVLAKGPTRPPPKNKPVSTAAAVAAAPTIKGKEKENLKVVGVLSPVKSTILKVKTKISSGGGVKKVVGKGVVLMRSTSSKTLASTAKVGSSNGVGVVVKSGSSAAVQKAAVVRPPAKKSK